MRSFFLRLKGYTKEIILLLTSIFLGLVIVELILSFIHPAPKFLQINIHSFGAEYLLSPNRKLIYVPKPNAGENNSYGHRGKEYNIAKQDKKRIIFMGDSVVEGLSVPYQLRFSEILNEIFHSECEIINLAVRGYNLQQEVEYFKEVGLKFSPDYVFWGITYNDLVLHSGEIFKLNEMIKDYDRGSFYIKYYKVKGGIEALLFKSNTYRYLVYLFSSHTKRNFEEEVNYEIKPTEVNGLLGEIKELSKVHQFDFGFVFLPVNTFYGSNHLSILKSAVNNARIDYIDLDEQVNSMPKSYSKKELFFKDDPCHFNIFGHRVVADLMRGQISNLLKTERRQVRH